MTTNLDLARLNMVEQQIRPWQVLDQGVLDLFTRVPREDFVPAQYRGLAFADLNIDLGRGEVMMAPKVEARMLQSLQIAPEDRILEIGTGSAYCTALLARSGRHVDSVDIYPEFTKQAAEKLRAHGITNVTLETGDAAAGWEGNGPYDVIAITGSLPTPPEHYPLNLAVGGRLFVVLGEAPVMEATLIRRVGEDHWLKEPLFETLLPALVNAHAPSRFVF